MYDNTNNPPNGGQEGEHQTDERADRPECETVYVLIGSSLTDDELDLLRWGADGGNNLD